MGTCLGPEVDHVLSYTWKLHLKVGCSNFGPVRDTTVYPTYQAANGTWLRPLRPPIFGNETDKTNENTYTHPSSPDTQ